MLLPQFAYLTHLVSNQFKLEGTEFLLVSDGSKDI